ncbi:MAG: Tryptophan-rich protein TspO [Chlamydiia bacterium]|nr:Tryptophan-rich protein TspO [Chlamydiia bacterium]
MKSISWKDVFIFICVYLVVLSIQFGGAAFTFTSLDNWYQNLNKPGWNPPDFVFGPVWMFLYFLIALSIWMVIRSNAKTKLKVSCYIVTIVSLVLNFFWTYFFFGLRSPLLGMIDIFTLILFILFSIYFYQKVNKIAAWLLVPYLLWVVYASTLNVAIFILN